MISEYLRVFRAFSDPNRFRVLELLCEGEQCACILLEDLHISQPTLSHHMKILCQSGIVKSRKVGPWNYYSIDTEGCEYANHLLKMVTEKKLSTSMKFMGVIYKFLPRGRRRSNDKLQTESEETCCCSE